MSSKKLLKRFFGTTSLNKITPEDTYTVDRQLLELKNRKEITANQHRTFRTFVANVRDDVLDIQMEKEAQKKRKVTLADLYIEKRKKKAEKKRERELREFDEDREWINVKLGALQSSVSTNRKQFVNTRFEVDGTLNETRDIVRNDIVPYLKGSVVKVGAIQLQFTANVKYKKEPTGEPVDWSHADVTQRILNVSDCNNIPETFMSWLQLVISETELKGSGFVFKKVLSIDVNVNKYQAPKGGSFIKLPDWIANKKACVNVDNSRYPNLCFIFSVCAALHPDVHNNTRASEYVKYLPEIKYEGLEFPLPTTGISKFEKMNSDKNIQVRLFGVEENTIIPMRQNNDLNAINILYYEGHYVWIKNLDKLLNSKSNDKRNNRKNCVRCLYGFDTLEALAEHNSRPCGDQAIQMPKEGQKVTFTRVETQVKHPFVIYADGESLVRKLNSCECKSDESWTTQLQRHDYISVGATSKFRLSKV